MRLACVFNSFYCNSKIQRYSMKKLVLVFVLMLIASSIHSQTPALFFESAVQDTIGFRIDSLLKNSTRNYVFYGIREFSSKPRKVLYCYKGANEEKPDSVKLIVKVKTIMVGANPDLEIEGTPHYEIEQVAGPLLDIMPFWNIIDSRSPEQVSKEGEIQVKIPDPDPQRGNRHYRIKRDNYSKGIWLLTRTW